MIVDKEPYLIEYNVRMGDPECQTILPKLKLIWLKYYLLVVMENSKILKLNGMIKSLCIVLCPKDILMHIKNIEIKNMKKINLNKNEFIFHAGTEKNEKIFAIGGRVLNFVAPLIILMMQK